MATPRTTRGPGASTAARRGALGLAALFLAAALAGCGGSSPPASSSSLQVTVSSTTKAHFTGVTCSLDPSGLVVTGKGSVANNGAGNLKLLLDVRDAKGMTVVLPGSDHARTISAAATTFNVPVHLVRDSTPVNCTLYVNSG